jgi:hypothetical protein
MRLGALLGGRGMVEKTKEAGKKKREVESSPRWACVSVSESVYAKAKYGIHW